MPTIYELWDTRSKNLLEEFDSESEALEAVRGYLDANNPELLDDLLVNPVSDAEVVGASGRLPVLRGDALRARIDALTAQAVSVVAGREAAAAVGRNSGRAQAETRA